MKLKDLPKGFSLVGCKIIIPAKIRREQSIPQRKMIITGGWNKGLWLKVKDSDSRVYPFTFDSFNEIKNINIIRELN